MYDGFFFVQVIIPGKEKEPEPKAILTTYLSDGEPLIIKVPPTNWQDWHCYGVSTNG